MTDVFRHGTKSPHDSCQKQRVVYTPFRAPSPMPGDDPSQEKQTSRCGFCKLNLIAISLFILIAGIYIALSSKDHWSDLPFRSSSVNLDPVDQQNLIPRDKPTVQAAYARISLPEYINRPQTDIKITGEKITILKGSSVQLRIRVSSQPKLAKASIDGVPVSHKIEGNEIILPPLHLLLESTLIELNWEDSHGLTNQTPFVCTFIIRPDQASHPSLTKRNNSLIVLEDSSIELDLEAYDDHGIKEMGIEWTLNTPPSLKGKPGKKQLTTFRKILVQGNQTQQNTKSSFVFSPRLQGIPPQEIILKTFANDYCPNNEESKSPPLVIKVMTKTEHAQSIRYFIERLVGELHEISKKLNESKEQVKILTLQTPESRRSKAYKQRVLDQADMANASHRKIETLSTFARRLFLSASQNEEIDPDGMKQMLNALALLSHDALQSAQQTEHHLSQAAERGETRALAKGISTLDHSETMIKTSMEQFKKSAKAIASGSFLTRLKKTAKNQQELGKLLAMEKQKNKSGETSFSNEKKRDEIQTLSTLQQIILNDVSWIKSDLKILKESEKSLSYENLYTQMIAIGLKTMLLENIEHIRHSRIKEAIEQSTNISRLLADLSKLIDKKRKSPRLQTTPQLDFTLVKGNEGDLSDSTFELMLKLMRIIGKQNNICLKTEDGNRDKQRENISNLPAEQRNQLLEEQDTLQADMVELMAEQSSPETINTLEECQKAMNLTVNLLEPGQLRQDAPNSQRSIMALLFKSAERLAAPPKHKPGKNASCMLNAMRYLPGIFESIPKQPGAGKSIFVPPSNCSREDLPEEFRKTFDAYRKTLRQ